MIINVPIQTKRLILREFKETDWKSVHSYAVDPLVVHYLTWGPNSEEDTKKFIRRTMEYQRSEPRKDFEIAVTLKTEQSLIGSCSISATDLSNQEGVIGYCFHPHFWGQNYATETAMALLEFGFEQFNLHRIFAVCAPENVASMRVLEKIGMQREGYLREHKWTGERWRDSFLYAILDHEWKRLKNGNIV